MRLEEHEQEIKQEQEEREIAQELERELEQLMEKMNEDKDIKCGTVEYYKKMLIEANSICITNCFEGIFKESLDDNIAISFMIFDYLFYKDNLIVNKLEHDSYLSKEEFVNKIYEYLDMLISELNNENSTFFNDEDASGLVKMLLDGLTSKNENNGKITKEAEISKHFTKKLDDFCKKIKSQDYEKYIPKESGFLYFLLFLIYLSKEKGVSSKENEKLLDRAIIGVKSYRKTSNWTDDSIFFLSIVLKMYREIENNNPEKEFDVSYFGVIEFLQNFGFKEKAFYKLWYQTIVAIMSTPVPYSMPFSDGEGTCYEEQVSAVSVACDIIAENKENEWLRDDLLSQIVKQKEKPSEKAIFKNKKRRSQYEIWEQKYFTWLSDFFDLKSGKKGEDVYIEREWFGLYKLKEILDKLDDFLSMAKDDEEFKGWDENKLEQFFIGSRLNGIQTMANRFWMLVITNINNKDKKALSCGLFWCLLIEEHEIMRNTTLYSKKEMTLDSEKEEIRYSEIAMSDFFDQLRTYIKVLNKILDFSEILKIKADIYFRSNCDGSYKVVNAAYIDTLLYCIDDLELLKDKKEIYNGNWEELLKENEEYILNNEALQG